MIITDSDQQQNHLKIHEQQINVYKYIPKAKPVIDQNIQISNEFNNKFKIFEFQQTQYQKNIHRNNLFKQNASIEQGYFFASNFQSGNLQEVRESKDSTYYLKIRSDSNSQYQSQWFNFKVKGIKKATFIIHSFKKANSLFNDGMKICIKEDEKWKRGGESIEYFEISQKKYALKFQYTFSKPDQITEFAYCFPFNCTDFNSYLNQILLKYKNLIKIQTITRTFLDNQIDCLTVAQESRKNIILVMSRVHPGQTVSSFVLQGFINFLLSDQQIAKNLLKFYQIKIIPILNPDGVKIGNYRYSYAGRDLNRCWKHPNIRITPQIYYTKIFIQKFQKRVCMVIDLHGHSQMKNVFFYGCNDNLNYNLPKKFPFIMSQISNYFSYQKCYFGMEKYREGTARIALWHMLRIPMVYTMQTSFCGNQNSDQNYTIDDFLKIGKNLGEGMSLYFNDNQFFQPKLQLFNKFQKYMNTINQNEIINQNQSQLCSEQNPSEGKYDDHQIIQFLQNFKKQKKISSQIKSKNSQNKTLRQTNLSNFIVRRSRMNPLNKVSNQITNLDQFQQRINLINRERAKSSQSSMNAINLSNSSTLNYPKSFKSFYLHRKDSQTLKVSGQDSSKLTSTKFIRNKYSKNNAISSIIIDDEFIKNGNLGKQDIKQKNYRARLMKEKIRFKSHEKNPIKEIITNSLSKKLRKKFTLKPMKTINYNSWREENLPQKKFLNQL